MKKILIIGTGYIGTHLGAFLKSKNHEIVYLTRTKNREIPNGTSYYWNPEKGEIDMEALRDVDVIINLSGDNIADKRWTAKRKLDLISSRIDPLNFLFKILKEQPNQTIKQLISCSAIGIYDMHDFNKLNTEDTHLGKGFVPELCEKWEGAIQQFSELGMEVTTLRLGVVVSSDGGMLQKLLKLAKFNLLTVIGSGNQIISWIQMDDLIRLFDFVMENRTVGIFNAIGANTTNRDFTNYIIQKTGSINWKLHLTCWLLNIVMGESSELLCTGSLVDNSKIVQMGFEFKNSELNHLKI